jgi:hypothetical protein
MKRKQYHQPESDMVQLPSETREAVRVFTNTIKKAVNDVRQAAVDNTHVGRNADEFLSELEGAYLPSR